MSFFDFSWLGVMRCIEEQSEAEVRTALRGRGQGNHEIEKTIETMKAFGICSVNGLEYLP